MFYQPALPASPGMGPPSIMSGFSTSVQSAARVSPIRLLCEQYRKVNELYALSQLLYTKL